MLEYVIEKFYDDAYFKRNYHDVNYFIYGINMYAHYLAYTKGCTIMLEEPWRILLALAHLPLGSKYDKLFMKYEHVITKEGKWNMKHHFYEGYWLADMKTFDRDLRYIEREWEIKQRTSNNAAFEIPINNSAMVESSSSHLLTPPYVYTTSQQHTPPASTTYTPSSPTYTPASPTYTPGQPPPYYSPNILQAYSNFDRRSSDSDYVPDASYETNDSRRE